MRPNEVSGISRSASQSCLGSSSTASDSTKASTACCATSSAYTGMPAAPGGAVNSSTCLPEVSTELHSACRKVSISGLTVVGCGVQ